MNVIVIWQSLVVSAYRSFWIHLAQALGGKMTAVVPHEFWELGGQTVSCAPFSPEWKQRIDTHVLKAWCPHIQAVWFRGLASVFRTVAQNAAQSMQKARKNSPTSRNSSTVLIALMEPYSLSALFVFVLARLFLPRQTQILFYSLQNIYKEFPLPLKLIQNFVFSRSPHILALSEEVTGVLRRQGYTGNIIRFPLWADSSLFHLLPESTQSRALNDFPKPERIRVSYCGAVTASKGVPDLVAAFEMLSPAELAGIHFEAAGGGPLLEEVRTRLSALEQRGLSLKLHGPVPATALPAFFNNTDILLVPSRTEAHWKEQFGRVIVEAWACGATVIGSNSGEIPVLLSQPDLIFEERNSESVLKTLRHAISLEHSERTRKVNAARAEPFLDTTLAQSFALELQKLATAETDSMNRALSRDVLR
jgi:glycosyltransferase involved in cell wall biosynthesis